MTYAICAVNYSHHVTELIYPTYHIRKLYIRIILTSNNCVFQHATKKIIHILFSYNASTSIGFQQIKQFLILL